MGGGCDGCTGWRLCRMAGRCGWFRHGGHVCLRGMAGAYSSIPFFRQMVFLSGSGPDCGVFRAFRFSLCSVWGQMR